MSDVIAVPAFPFVPPFPGVPTLIRAAADASLSQLLTQAAGGVIPPVLVNMVAGSVPSMLNGFPASALSPAGIAGLLGDVTGGTALTADGATAIGAAPPAQWGIFDSGGGAVAEADNVMRVSQLLEFRVPDYPVEEGAFASYNKVATPRETRVTFTKGGTLADKTAFLAAIDAAVKGLDLYSVVTPEATYTNQNLTHYDYERTAVSGATLLTVEVWAREIRVTATATYSNTAQPGGADPLVVGTVQGQPATAQTAAQAKAVLALNTFGPLN